MEKTALKQCGPRRRWSLAEKRQIVELTLNGNASVAEIARDYGAIAVTYASGKRSTRLDDLVRPQRMHPRSPA